MRDLLTVTQAAETYGVSRATIDRWIDEGVLPVIRPYPKARRLLRRADLELLFEPLAPPLAAEA
jgi:excisionase family DNA binding protein